MIRRFNQQQILVALLAVIAGTFCSWLGYLFFRYLPTWALARLGMELTVETERLVGWLGLLSLFSSGFAIWKKGGGLITFGDSVFYSETLATSSSGGAYLVNRQLTQVTGTSHAISQLFLAGPLMLLNAIKRFANLVPQGADLEARMTEVLSAIRNANQWQSLEDYPGREEEIRYLARIGAVDFGSPKGVPRFKMNKNYGN